MSWLSPGLLLKMYLSVLPVCMYVYHMHTWYLWMLERTSDPLELNLWAVLSHHVGTRAKPVSSAKTANALNH